MCSKSINEKLFSLHRLMWQGGAEDLHYILKGNRLNKGNNLVEPTFIGISWEPGKTLLHFIHQSRHLPQTARYHFLYKLLSQ